MEPQAYFPEPIAPYPQTFSDSHFSERGDHIFSQPAYLIPYRESCQPARMGELSEAFKDLQYNSGRQAAQLVEQFVPQNAPVSQIADVLFLARTNPPTDVRRFVQDINRLLDIFQLRICADGQLYRLKVAQGRDRYEYLQLLGERSRSRGFQNTPFYLVAVDAEHNKRGRKLEK